MTPTRLRYLNKKSIIDVYLVSSELYNYITTVKPSHYIMLEAIYKSCYFRLQHEDRLATKNSLPYAISSDINSMLISSRTRDWNYGSIQQRINVVAKEQNLYYFLGKEKFHAVCNRVIAMFLYDLMATTKPYSRVDLVSRWEESDEHLLSIIDTIDRDNPFIDTTDIEAIFERTT